MNGALNVFKEDLRWSDASDFTIKNGDLEDTSTTVGLGFLDECKRRIASSFGDWKRSPSDGASLWMFEGRMNNEDTWEDVSYAISSSLRNGMFLMSSDFKITIVPVASDAIAGRIDFSSDLMSLLGVVLNPISVVYSLSGNRPYFVG